MRANKTISLQEILTELDLKSVCNIFVVTGGAFSIFLGCLVLLGWYTQMPRLIQIHSSFVPMQYNTALCFLFSGFSLLAASLARQHIARIIVSVPILLGLLTLAEYIWNFDAGIDQLFMEHYITTKTSHPGRMAPNTALSFVLIGTTIFLLSARFKKDILSFIIAILGSVLWAFGVVPLAGYLGGIETAYSWENLTRMAIHTATGFTVLGISLVSYAWKICLLEKQKIPKWMPLVCCVFVLVVSVLGWQALRQRELENVKSATTIAASKLAYHIQSNMNSLNNALTRMSSRWVIDDKPQFSSWEADAKNHIKHMPGFQSIEWVDSDYTVRWIVPMMGNEAALGLNLGFETIRKKALDRAKMTNIPTASKSVDLVQGGKGFQIYYPLYRNGKFEGFLRAVFRFNKLFAFFLQDDPLTNDFVFTVNEDSTQLFKHSINEREPTERFLTLSAIRVLNLNWYTEVIPTKKWIARQQSALPEIVFGMGCILAFFLTASAKFGLTAFYKTRESQKANIALSRSEAKFKTLIDTGPNAVIVVNQEGKVELVNAAVLNWFGYSEDELIGGSIEKLVPEEARNRHIQKRKEYSMKPDTRLMSTRNNLSAIRKNGSEFPVEITLVPIEENDEVKVMATIVDITERKENEKKIKEKEAVLQQVLESTMAGYWDWFIQEDYEYMSPGFKAMFGYKEHELPNKPDSWQKIIHPDDLPRILEVYKKHVDSKGKVPFDNIVRYFHKDGSTLWISCRGKVIEWDKDGKPVRMVGSHVDLTSLKQAEEALRASESRFKRLYESNIIGMIFGSTAGDILDANDRFLETVGYERKDLPIRWDKMTPPEYAELDQIAIKQMAENNVCKPFEKEYYRKDGSRVHILIGAVLLEGSDDAVACFVLDITNRKEAEAARDELFEQLYQKNKELEQVVYIASHDLRSPLVNIQGFSKELENYCEDISRYMSDETVPETIRENMVTIVDEEIPESLNFIKTSAGKMDGLLTGLLQISRLGRADLSVELINMNDLLADVVSNFEFLISKESGKIIVEDLPRCYGDSRQVNQVFSNLIDNALKYRNLHHSVRIDISGEVKDGEVVYCIKDNGQGIAPAHQKVVFEIFHRLDPSGTKGEGLGLSIIKKILDRHGGSIWVESELGKGSAFYISLPRFPFQPFSMIDEQNKEVNNA